MTRPAASRPTRESRIRRTAPAPIAVKSSDWSRWLGLAVGAFPLTAIIYAVGRLVYDSSYRVFGLTPEDVGLTQTRIVFQAVGATGVVLGLIASLGLVAWAQVLLIRSTEAQYRRSPAVSAKTAAIQAVVVGAPLLAAVFAPLAVPRGWQRTAVLLAIFVLAAGVWVSAALDWTTRGFVAGAVLMAVLGCVVYTYSTLKPGFRQSALWLAFLTLGYLVPHFDIPHFENPPRLTRLGVQIIRGTLVLLAVWAATLADGLLQAWLGGIVLALVFTWWWYGVLADGAASLWLDRRLPGWRIIGLFVLAGMVLGLGVVWVTAEESSGINRARDIRQGESVPHRYIFPIESAPARLAALTGDPLGLCNKQLVARLLGRNGDTAFVLFRPPGEGRVAESFVLPLPESDYSVATGYGEPGLCEPP